MSLKVVKSLGVGRFLDWGAVDAKESVRRHPKVKINGFTLIDEEKIKAGVYRVYQTLLTEMGIVGRVLGVFSLECWEKKGLET